jgi:hypothetical protein
MKKILASLILVVLFLGMTSVLAQTGPQNYCQLKIGVAWKGSYYKTGDTVGTEVPCLDKGKIVSDCDGTVSAGLPKKDAYVGGFGAKYDSTKDGIIDAADSPVTFQTPDWGMICFVNTVGTITNWIFYVMTAIAVLLFVYGGITYMIALGDPEKASKGGRIIIYAIIGLIIALVAKIVPNIVTTLIR